MKYKFSVYLIFLSLTFGMVHNVIADDAQIGTGNWIYSECKGEPELSIGLCMGYIMAIADSINVMSKFEFAKENSCMGKKVTVGQIKDVVVRFLEDNPAIRDQLTFDLIVKSLRKSFPCNHHKKLEGYGGFLFGMTIEDADQLRKDDSLTECDFKGAFRCLEFKDSVFGGNANVIVQFDATTKLLYQVVIQYDFLENTIPGKCIDTARKVKRNFIHKNGLPNKEVKNRALTWVWGDGGEAKFNDLCMTGEIGMVLASYSEKGR